MLINNNNQGCTCNNNSTPRSVKHQKAKRAIIIIIILFVVVFMVGIIGYKYFLHMNTEEAIFNTSLTVSNLGIGHHEKTIAEKLFTSIYSIFAGIFFLSLTSAIIAYIFILYFED